MVISGTDYPPQAQPLGDRVNSRFRNRALTYTYVTIASKWSGVENKHACDVKCSSKLPDAYLEHYGIWSDRQIIQPIDVGF